MRLGLFTVPTLGMLAVALQIVGCGNSNSNNGGGNWAVRHRARVAPARPAAAEAQPIAPVAQQVSRPAPAGRWGPADTWAPAARWTLAVRRGAVPAGAPGSTVASCPGRTGGSMPSSCTGKAWPTGGDPTVAGPFAIATDKNVGPLAGYDAGSDLRQTRSSGSTSTDQRIWRPRQVLPSHHRLGATVTPTTPNRTRPCCLVVGNVNKWCGTYKVLINQLASHGFVVVASLSTIVSQPDPATGALPQLVGLNWILQQSGGSDQPLLPSPRHGPHRRRRSLGGCDWRPATIGSDPRISSAIATMAGATSMPKLHEPALFLCGGQDTVVPCSNIQTGVRLPSPRRRSCWRRIPPPVARKLDRFNQGPVPGRGHGLDARSPDG